MWDRWIRWGDEITRASKRCIITTEENDKGQGKDLQTERRSPELSVVVLFVPCESSFSWPRDGSPSSHTSQKTQKLATQAFMTGVGVGDGDYFRRFGNVICLFYQVHTYWMHHFFYGSWLWNLSTWDWWSKYGMAWHGRWDLGIYLYKELEENKNTIFETTCPK